MSDNMTPADMAAVVDGNRGYGDGMGCGGGWGMMWIFMAFILFGAGGFGGWGNRNGNAVTEAGLCDAMNFNNLENAVGRMSDNMNAIARQQDNATCNLGYENARLANETQRQIADCCCTTQRAIDSVNYNGAMNTAEINKVTTEQTQKILDVLCGNRMADMQNQINQLQLQSALCGVVRYPNQVTYGAGPSPFFGWGNCGCNTGCCGTSF